MHSPLSICTFFPLDSLAQSLAESLSGDDRYVLAQHPQVDPFREFIEKEKHHLDCLILQDTPELKPLITWLYGRATLLPAVVVSHFDDVYSELTQGLENTTPTPFLYHMAEIKVSASDLKNISFYIEQAIAQFINLSPTSWVKTDTAVPPPQTQSGLSPLELLLPQQQRLAEKLKERLGYLGVYYKRDPQTFFRYLSPEQKQELLDTLKESYREIVLRYFTDDGTVNQRIDSFVNTAFFTDVSAAQIVELHMELIDEFSKHLKLEGRSEEILLDYRLTLIDTIAHLCEMYRRSIPRET